MSDRDADEPGGDRNEPPVDPGAEGAQVADPSPAVSRHVRRGRRVLVWIAVIAASASLSGMIASLWVKSPAQRAAEVAPPTPSVITATVAATTLSDTIAVRGDVVASDEVAITARAAPPHDALLVVTAVPVAAGDTVNAGSLVAEVAGRPVFVLSGAVPGYRTLTPGLTGRDVGELRQALTGLGYTSSDDENVFGPSTQRAVTAFYHDRGYEPLTTSDLSSGPGQDEIAAAESTQRQAERALRDAQGGDASAIADAQQDLRDAKAALQRLQSRSGVVVPLGEVQFVPTLPASVARVSTPAGAQLTAVTDTILTLRTGGLTVRAALPAGDGGRVHEAMTVEIVDDVAGRSAQGTVTAIVTGASGAASTGEHAAAASSDDTSSAPSGDVGTASGGQDTLVVTPSTELDASWLGANVLVRVAVSSTDQAVLVVPVTAIATRADGTAAVEVRTGDGTSREVEVTPGLSVDGRVQVTPRTDGGLAAGDQVVVGQP